MENRIIAEIKNRKKIARETYQIDFILEKEINFVAGQHIGIWLPKLIYDDPKGSFRLFSICSSPKNKKMISIAFRDTKSGFKKTLLKLPIGTEVELMKPTGFFVLPKDQKQRIGFIAGGIGITPFMSMLNYAKENKLSQKITLYYLNSSKEKTAFFYELKQLTDNNKNFVLKNFLGRKKFLEQIKKIKNQERILWYIAGPPGLVADIKNILISMGVSQNKILTEEFSGY
ncbi:MAG: FAD-dependent oxidoreductase [Candidatus Pacearchaeota archaeon]